MSGGQSYCDVWEGVTAHAATFALKDALSRSFWDHSPTRMVHWDLTASPHSVPTCVGFLSDERSALILDWVLRVGEATRVDPDWLVIAYKAGDELALSDIEVILSDLTKLLSAERFAEVDHGLAGADPGRMTADAIVAITHITYPAKLRLSAWQNFVDRSRAALLRRGDLEDHLEGLD